MTDLGEVEFGEIAEGPVEAQQWVDLAVPPVLVLACREREAGQRPPGFYELLHRGQVGAGHVAVAGAFDASPGVSPEGGVPSRAARIVPRDEERIAADVRQHRSLKAVDFVGVRAAVRVRARRSSAPPTRISTMAVAIAVASSGSRNDGGVADPEDPAVEQSAAQKVREVEHATVRPGGNPFLLQERREVGLHLGVAS